MTKVILNNDQKFNHVLSRVKDVLFLKSQREKMPQDEKNKTRIGGVDFWFALKKDTDQIYLIYNTPPDSWNLDDIKNDLDEFENAFYMNNIFNY